MKHLIIVRGGGDIATGTIHKLFSCGFPVLVLEAEYPSAIRRKVAFSEAVYDGETTVEGITCVLAKDLSQAKQILSEGKLPLMVDPDASCLKELSTPPLALVDGILAKKNLGTRMDMAPLTIALGPGFYASRDVHMVIETMRGHNLGRIITEGSAMPNTGVPGPIAGFTKERVIHSPAAGIFRNVSAVTDTVKQDEIIAYVECEDGTRIDIPASIDGLLRGLLRDGYPVTKGFKVADIDPRLSEYNNCFTISDKARCIAGGVLEAILRGSGLARRFSDDTYLCGKRR